MRQLLSRAARVAAVALGALAFTAGVATAGDHEAFIAGTATTKTSATSFFAPLWVYPSMQGIAPLMVAPPPAGPGTLVIREAPSLLTPADLRFSVESENGVTVVRGPRAR
ncbi:MAG: hypothetical protein KGL11_09830 [Alphaproteobacteria bacterium]|nr:hypothetical protein [Alphaproteobacteria bacterium]